MKIRHLSPSALEAWDYCPEHRYARSYRDRAPMEPNVPVWFGLSIHEAAEAMHRGKDWEAAWYREWRTRHADLLKHGVSDAKERMTLGERGFALLDELAALEGVSGEPECSFVYQHPSLPVPFKGRIDLTDTANHKLYDWKTANYAWGQKKADGKLWQPAIYSLQYEAQHGVWPRFFYVVMPLTGAPRAIMLERTIDKAEAERAMGHAAGILERIGNDDFPCYCKGKEKAPGPVELAPTKRTTDKMFQAA